MILCDGNVKNVVQEWKIRIALEHFRAWFGSIGRASQWQVLKSLMKSHSTRLAMAHRAMFLLHIDRLQFETSLQIVHGTVSRHATLLRLRGNLKFREKEPSRVAGFLARRWKLKNLCLKWTTDMDTERMTRRNWKPVTSGMEDVWKLPAGRKEETRSAEHRKSSETWPGRSLSKEAIGNLLYERPG